MFDVSAEGANLGFNVSNFLLVVSALAVAGFTYLSIQFANIKEKFSDERIAANEAETKRAVADSDTAKEGAARANERIAELSTQAEGLKRDAARFDAQAREAEFKLEQLRKASQPRMLDRNFSKALAGIKPAAAKIVFVKDTSDAFPLAIEIFIALREAGWLVTDMPSPIMDSEAMFPNIPMSAANSVGASAAGISVVARNIDNNPTVEAMTQAFAANFGSAHSGRDDRLPEGFLRIVIAPRP